MTRNHWRGRTHEREVKLHLFPTVRHDVSRITMGWRGRATEREVKLHILGTRATLPRDWHGRTQEREVKLHRFPTVWRDASKITMDWRGRATVNAR